MAKEESKEGSKKKAKVEKEGKTSVSSYKKGIEVEKQKMTTSVKSLQGDFKKFAKDIKEKGKAMIEEGIKHMGGIIKAQVKENKEAVSHMEGNVKFLLGEINKKKKDFQAYSSAFWG